jgi:hypothetical protein
MNNKLILLVSLVIFISLLSLVEGKCEYKKSIQHLAKGKKAKGLLLGAKRIKTLNNCLSWATSWDEAC